MKKIFVFIMVMSILITMTSQNLTQMFSGKQQVKAAQIMPKSPRVYDDGGVEYYDSIWFGSYPQTEIVDKASTSGVYGKDWETGLGYEVDASLYDLLRNSTEWDSNNDITLSGKKYRRMKKDDTASSYNYSSDDLGNYTWKDDTSYHYFRYDKIKWRVLEVSGNVAFLVSEKVIDCQTYHNSSESPVTWQTSTIRSWLNGYDPSKNSCGIDYQNNNFLDVAFTPSEQNIIRTTGLANDHPDNGGGKNTSDKIFLLSHDEEWNDLCFGTEDSPSECVSSTYAKAMGISSEHDSIYSGNCSWVLRSSTDSEGEVVYIDHMAHTYGANANTPSGIRPALNLNLSSTGLWSYAGRIVPYGYRPNGKVQHITLTGISDKIAEGKTISLIASVFPKNAKNKKLKWSVSHKSRASVTQTGRVTIKKGSAGKAVNIIAEATDGSGTSSFYYKIKIMKGAVKSIKIKGAKKKLTAGKTMKLKAVIKTTKGKPVNKTVIWTSSNDKYAKVSSTGKVKALKAGKGKKVTITVQSTDGTNKKKKISFKIK